MLTGRTLLFSWRLPNAMPAKLTPRRFDSMRAGDLSSTLWLTVLFLLDCYFFCCIGIKVAWFTGDGPYWSGVTRLIVHF